MAYHVYVQIDGALVLVRAGGVPVKVWAPDILAAIAIARESYPRFAVAVGETS